jgi:hypothetical protein
VNELDCAPDASICSSSGICQDGGLHDECTTRADCGSSTFACGTQGCQPPCLSNSQCEAPESVCDLALGICVECLTFTDCAYRPSTVCSRGRCVCSVADQNWCEPDLCVNLEDSQTNCGRCGHACFGSCVAGECEGAWEPTALEGAPTVRSQHTAIWTGTQMVIWGGSSDDCASCTTRKPTLGRPPVRSTLPHRDGYTLPSGQEARCWCGVANTMAMSSGMARDSIQ